MEQYTIEQLKVMAYDSFVEIERLQNNLKLINQEIQRRNSEPKQKNNGSAGK